MITMNDLTKFILKPITNSYQEEEALRILKEYEAISIDKKTKNMLEVLKILVNDWREKQSIEATNPIRIIHEKMAKLNLLQKDLIPIFGSKARTSEILSGKRNLTVKHIYNIYKYLNIFPELLMDNKKLELSKNKQKIMKKRIEKIRKKILVF